MLPIRAANGILLNSQYQIILIKSLKNKSVVLNDEEGIPVTLFFVKDIKLKHEGKRNLTKIWNCVKYKLSIITDCVLATQS